MHTPSEIAAGARLTKTVFHSSLKFYWKFIISLIDFLVMISLQDFEHATTAGLSWHVQNFVAITPFEFG